jgi:hypothetical protein
VSHAPERKEKNCLNCGPTVIGRYCHICGQENIVPKERFGNLVIHFFYDITHFDGKFFHTLQFLLFRPGFLSKEYIKGRRATYLNPVRMYVFTSAFFFLIFFLLYNPKNNLRTNLNDPLSRKDRMDMIANIEDELKKEGVNKDTLLGELKLLNDTLKPLTNGDAKKFAIASSTLGMNGKNYRSISEYDSVQNKLSSSQKDKWLKKMFVKKEIQLTEKYRKDPGHFFETLVNDFLHKLPYLLFVSLPLFALILKLLYIRRKQFYYADHAIFSIHHYIFSFILLLFIFLFDEIRNGLHWEWLKYISAGLFILWPVYLFMALYNFYGQRRFKTFVKFVLLNLLGFISLTLLFVIFILLSAFQV